MTDKPKLQSEPFETTRWCLDRAGMNIGQDAADEAEAELKTAEETARQRDLLLKAAQDAEAMLLLLDAPYGRIIQRDALIRNLRSAIGECRK